MEILLSPSLNLEQRSIDHPRCTSLRTWHVPSRLAPTCFVPPSAEFARAASPSLPHLSRLRSSPLLRHLQCCREPPGLPVPTPPHPLSCAAFCDVTLATHFRPGAVLQPFAPHLSLSEPVFCYVPRVSRFARLSILARLTPTILRSR
jgi:hypothetical protein